MTRAASAHVVKNGARCGHGKRAALQFVTGEGCYVEMFLEQARAIFIAKHPFLKRR